MSYIRHIGFWVVRRWRLQADNTSITVLFLIRTLTNQKSKLMHEPYLFRSGLNHVNHVHGLCTCPSGQIIEFSCLIRCDLEVPLLSNGDMRCIAWSKWHNNDITQVSWPLKSKATWLFPKFRIATKTTLLQTKLCVTGSLWGESTVLTHLQMYFPIYCLEYESAHPGPWALGSTVH